MCTAESGVRVTSGDEARFASLYGRYQRKVAAYCRRRADLDQVEDLTAEVFLTVWRMIGEVPEGDDALRWIYRIAYLVINNHWRKSGRTKKLAQKLDAIGISHQTALQDQVVMRQELREVLEAASRLKSRDQEILRLSLWEQLSHEDIGVVLDIEPNAAKQRLHRARKSLVREHQRVAKNPALSPAAQEGGEQ